MCFRSKIDLWLGFLMGASILLSVVILWMSSGELEGAALVFAWGSVGLFAVFVAWLFLSTYYEIDENDLRVVCGPFRWMIPLKDIQNVKGSKSLLSSPALSLDRIEITYGKGKKILVSPKDKAGFKAELLSRR